MKANPDLKWETTTSRNIGFDFGLWGSRLSGTLDLYWNTTSDLLMRQEIDSSTGYSYQYRNIGQTSNKGVELALNYHLIRTKDFNLNVSATYNFNKNNIDELDGGKDIYYNSGWGSSAQHPSYDYVLSEGKPVGVIRGFKSAGFYTVDDFVDTNSWKLKDGVASIKGVSPRPGDLKFKNLRDDDKSTNQIDSGDGTLDNPGDQKVIGNSLPKYLYGITLGANYKGFDLNIMMQGTGQRDAWIANNLVFPMYIYSVNDIKYQPLFDGLTDYWRPVDAANGDYTAVNPNAKYPRMYGQNPTVGSNYGRKTDKYLSNAAYFRIKNVTLSYTVPKTWISRIGLNQLKGFVSVENLATFSSLPSGIDPETLSWNYPAFRTVSFGINFTL